MLHGSAIRSLKLKHRDRIWRWNVDFSMEVKSNKIKQDDKMITQQKDQVASIENKTRRKVAGVGLHPDAPILMCNNMMIECNRKRGRHKSHEGSFKRTQFLISKWT